MCMRGVALQLNLLNPPTGQPANQPAEMSTCGGELQISLHKGFPLLLEELARDETGAAALDVTGLPGAGEKVCVCGGGRTQKKG